MWVPGIFPKGKCGRCVGLTLPPSCADCLEICEPQPPGTLWELSAVYRGTKKKRKIKTKNRFISFKMRAKRERAETWWNPTAQMRSVLHSSSFAPVLTLPRRTCLHSASSVLAVRISCRVTADFVFREHLFIYKLYRIYVCYTNITLYITFGIIRGFT
jgi:hypothetical protein